MIPVVAQPGMSATLSKTAGDNAFYALSGGGGGGEEEWRKRECGRGVTRTRAAS